MWSSLKGDSIDVFKTMAKDSWAQLHWFMIKMVVSWSKSLPGQLKKQKCFLGEVG